jgi:hypothetical protein
MKSTDLDQQIYEFNFNAQDIIPSKKDILTWLNYDIRNYPAFLDDAIKNSIEIIAQSAQPIGGFVIISSDKVTFRSNGILINGVQLESEKIISRYFKQAQSIAIMLSTIGDKPESISKQLINQGDTLAGYIIDSAASLAVERTADLVERKLNETVNSDGFKATNRYSPGYCGWNVSDQHKLFSFLPENFCGVKLNESALMIPIKSVSAIVGLGNDVIKEDYNCDLCDIDFCYKRDKVNS